MEDFFSQYGKVIMVIVVVVVLLMIVGTNADAGLSGMINDGLKSAIDKFQEIFTKIPGVGA